MRQAEQDTSDNGKDVCTEERRERRESANQNSSMQGTRTGHSPGWRRMRRVGEALRGGSGRGRFSVTASILTATGEAVVWAARQVCGSYSRWNTVNDGRPAGG